MYTKWYPLCRGAGFTFCARCRRHAERPENELAARQPHQQWLVPRIEGWTCLDYQRNPWRYLKRSKT